MQPRGAKAWAECARCYISGVFRANAFTQDIKSAGYRGGERQDKDAEEMQSKLRGTLDTWCWVLLPSTGNLVSQQLPKP